jgi:hypothetical protein
VDTARAEYLAASGVTAEAAQGGYGDIAFAMPVEQGIAQRFGESVDQGELEAAKFSVEGSAEAEEKLRRINAAEAGLFGGKPGASTGSLSKSTAGSY